MAETIDEKGKVKSTKNQKPCPSGFLETQKLGNVNRLVWDLSTNHNNFE